MEFPLKEPANPRYMYRDSENIIHLFMPITGGTRVGTDNTCKAVCSLQEFFGKGTQSNSKITVKGELLACQKALEYDLSILPSGLPLTQQKQSRLMQINVWIEVVKLLEVHAELNCLNLEIPSYPKPLESMMQDPNRSNVYSMILRPAAEDGYLRLEGANAVFSVAHTSILRQRFYNVSTLQTALIDAYNPLIFKAKGLKAQVIQETLSRLNTPVIPVDFVHLREIFQEVLTQTVEEPVDLMHTPEGCEVDQEYLKNQMHLNEQSTPEDYMSALLGYCVPHLFSNILESPFNQLKSADHYSITTQFLLGLINIYGVVHDHLDPQTNLGHILDRKPALSQDLAKTLAKAQQNENSIEDACFSWIDAHAKELNLRYSFYKIDREAIKKHLNVCYADIKDSRHFDEFLFFQNEKEGDFVSHQSSICISLAKFAAHPLLELPHQVIQTLPQTHILGLNIPQNSTLQEHVFFDLSCMSLTEIKALYDRINSYQDLIIRTRALAQLRVERPDFNPYIHEQKLLQCVAYGEQDEAEELLKREPVMTQKLLTAKGISFTDYSGRTFFCTAYEYAYWATDTHMCRMLERYMDADTKQILLRNIQLNEQAQLTQFGLFKPPKGCFYRQNELDCHSVHFDLTPLKTALTSYIDAYKSNSKKTEADWAYLDSIWIKIGLLQKDLPAHIAQEYCHPDRSFEDVVKTPSLLDERFKRQLQFYNFAHRGLDSWFSSNLGHSFAIVRCDARRGYGVDESSSVRGEVLHNELLAIEAIERVRTEDLKASVAILEHTLSL